jgi:histidine triad (HIT) family protein
MKLDEPYNNENIFAKILRGDLPAIKLYEDDTTLAFMDIMPQIEGHCLVICKEPATNLLTVSPQAAQDIICTTQLVAGAVQNALTAPGIMIAQLSGSAAGQTVPHIHMHILPRYNGIELAFHAQAVADMNELETVAAKIRSAL